MQDFFSSLENLLYDEIWDLEKEAAQYSGTQYLENENGTYKWENNSERERNESIRRYRRVISDTARPPTFGSPPWLSQWDVHHNSVPLAFRLRAPVSYWYRTTNDGFD